jgi:hypothetical protein
MITIVQAMKDSELFAPWFKGKSWGAWISFLKALFGLPMNAAEQAIYQKHTARSTMPHKAFKEAWLVVGRRGGKSLIAALTAVYLATFKDYSPYLAPGEVATVMLIAADRRQSRTLMRYIVGFLEGVSMLGALVVRKTSESVELSNGAVIEIHTSNFRAVRGYSVAAVVADEIAFWRSEESANPDTEILNAVRPAMATLPGALLLCISSPYARHGALWQAYKKHFGKDGSSVLVWQADTRSMNATVPMEVINDAFEADPASAAAEYGAQFRTDVESFIALETVEACVVPNRVELPFVQGVRYSGFVDPSGGSSDSFTLAIAHRSKDIAILDFVCEKKPPFSPENVCKEFAEILRKYRITRVHGDRYAGEWPREQFRKHGIAYQPSEKSKSEIYLEALPLLNSGKCELLDSKKLHSQLLGLERRTARGGKDSIDHSPGSHDDLINSAAGALLLASRPSRAFVGLGSSLTSSNAEDQEVKEVLRKSILQQQQLQQQRRRY